jgi:hypothetical protein
VLNDGRIIGRKITLYVDAGAYARHSPYGTTKAHRKIAEGTALVEVIQKAAELAGHELPDSFRRMSSMGEGR